MRELNTNEVSYVSGALNCIDANIYQSLHDQAVFTGELFGLGGALVAGTIAFALTMPLAAAPGAVIATTAYVAPAVNAALVGAAVFPWLAMYGYGKSGVWAPYFGQQ
ncbi:MAG: hypothetical protein JSR17_03735 [Proteobacteria bacterium]|nr:hypothetical protein [Pseudomonadota bacterium]